MKIRIAIMLSLVLGALAITGAASAAPWHGSGSAPTHSSSSGGGGAGASGPWHGGGRAGGWGHGGGWRGGYRGGGWGLGWDLWFPFYLGAAYDYGYDYPYYYAPYDYPVGDYAASPPAPVAVVPQKQYWYWCAQSKAYYPYVQTCAGAWQPVPTTPPPASSPAPSQ